MPSKPRILRRKLVVNSYQHQSSATPTRVHALSLHYHYSTEISCFLLSLNPNPSVMFLDSFSSVQSL